MLRHVMSQAVQARSNVVRLMQMYGVLSSYSKNPKPQQLPGKEAVSETPINMSEDVASSSSHYSWVKSRPQLKKEKCMSMYFFSRNIEIAQLS